MYVTASHLWQSQLTNGAQVISPQPRLVESLLPGQATVGGSWSCPSNVFDIPRWWRLSWQNEGNLEHHESGWSNLWHIYIYNYIIIYIYVHRHKHAVIYKHMSYIICLHVYIYLYLSIHLSFWSIYLIYLCNLI